MTYQAKAGEAFKFDPTQPDDIVRAVIAILGADNLARGPQAFAEAIDASNATVYRKLADGQLRAKLLDSKPLIPFWEQVRFLACLPDWQPLAKRKLAKREPAPGMVGTANERG